MRSQVCSCRARSRKSLATRSKPSRPRRPRRCLGTELQRTVHVGRAQPAGLGGLQVAGVRGHQHQFVRRAAEQPCGHQVHLGVGLVLADQLAGEHAVPGQAGVAGHVHQQRDVAVGQRADRVSAAQPVQAADRVGPRHQAVPDKVELHQFRLGQRLQAEARHQAVEDLPVQGVDVGPVLAGPARAVHRRCVARAPGIGEGRPVDLQAPGSG